MERDALIAHGTSFLLQDRLMNCSDYSTAWVCRTCGSLISLGYDDVSLGEVVAAAPAPAHAAHSEDGGAGAGAGAGAGQVRHAASNPTAAGGEYCRVCRAAAEEEDERERRALATGQNPARAGQAEVRVALPSANVLGSGRARKGGDLDIVAVPYVFRYLCAELASMGIAVSLSVQ